MLAAIALVGLTLWTSFHRPKDVFARTFDHNRSNAGIVAVDGDPLADINVLVDRVQWVMKCGVIVCEQKAIVQPSSVAEMTFDESMTINAEPLALFRLTQDYDRRLEWDPFLRSATLVGDASEAGVGVRALCVAKSGWAMETEYVSFNPPRAAAVKMTRGPWFLASFAGSWRFEEIEPGRTRVSFCYSLEAWPRPWSWLLTPILARVFARVTHNRLRALQEAVEHGVNSSANGQQNHASSALPQIRIGRSTCDDNIYSAGSVEA